MNENDELMLTRALGAVLLRIIRDAAEMEKGLDPDFEMMDFSSAVVISAKAGKDIEGPWKVTVEKIVADHHFEEKQNGRKAH